MRKNYPKLSIDPLDQSIVLETLNQRIFEKILLFLIFYLCATTTISAQCNADTPIPFINSTYGNLTATSSINGVCVLCAAPNAARLIDSDLNNFATSVTTIGALGSTSYRVTDTDTDYLAGTYVGYRIDTGSLLSVNLLGSITIKTYLNGSLKETASGSSLLGVGLLNGSGNNYVVGFNTTQDFDAIEISFGGLASLLNTIDVYYPVIRNYCAGPALACNATSAMNLPTYPVSLEPSHTGISGVTVGSNVSDANNVISTNTNDYATINLAVGVGATGSISVKDQLTDYPIGTYAGFEIENSNLLSVSALGNISITTYLNGVQQEQFLGNNLVVNGSLLSNPGRYKVGFVSTKAFDEVRLSINQTVALNLGSTKVYSAVFEKFCAGPDLVCNTQTAMLAPTYPVYINGTNTGIDGLVCALCSINNADNLIDQNTSNFAQINLTVSVGNSGSISVKDQVTDYPIGSFAGFTIENPSLLNVNALDAVTIRTYLNGVLQETKSGNAALAVVGTNLLVGSSPQTIGFVTTKAFDEARITLTNTATVSLGVVNVYNAIFQKLCPVTLECDKTYSLTNPTFPVTIDSGKTGVDGVACVACAVNNTNNVLTPSTTDFATILVTAGVIAPASIAVLDHLSTYPAGTYAGFTIKDLNSLIQLDLFNSLTISTYLDGVLKESKSASSLLNLTLTLSPYGTGSGMYNVGFKTTQSFDEIRISVGSLASVINDINVYGAFVNTASTSGGTLHCAVIDAVNDVLPSTIGATGNANTANVLTNDTINATPIAITDIDLSVTTPAVQKTVGAPVPSIDPSTGIVSIPVGTPAGNYTITYQICYKLNSLTCDSATVTVPVTAAVIDAVADANTAMVYGSTGGNTGINVYANDTLNGGSVNVSDVVLTSTPKGPLTVNTDGSVIVAANTPGGTYTVDYSICEKLNPSNCDTATVTVFVSTPSIAVVKIGAVGGSGTLGDIITYTFSVTNTGNTPLTNVVINDVLLGSVNLPVTPTTLAPNGTGTATATYTIKQADVDAGKVTNTATVTGTTPDNGTVSDISGTTISDNIPTVTTLTPNPKIALVKVGSVGGTGTVGDIITYTFTVTNTGNTTLSNVVVNDALTASVNLAVTPSTLAPNTTGTATATYVIKQVDVDAGKVTNTATVKGTPPVGIDVTDISGTTITNNTPTETPLTPNPKIALVKTAVVGGTGAVGYAITYTFTVTNTGNTTLSNVVVNDPLIGTSDFAVTPSTLAPNATGIVTASHTILQSDMDAGKVTNSATTTGTTPAGGTVSDISGTTITNNTPTVTTLSPNSNIALVKTAVIGGTGVVGNLITYTFTVTNTGNTTLSNIVVNDPLIGASDFAVTPSTLAPNATGIATATHAILQSDMDAGIVTNSATVTGTKPLGGTVSDISGTTITNNTPTVTTLTPNSNIALVKTGIVSGTGAIGNLITYTFTVTNTGNTTLSNVVVNDALTASVNLAVTPSTLAPNTTGTVTTTYTIKQSDIDAGMVTNSATVTGTKPLGGTVSDTSGITILDNIPTVTTLTPNSSIALVKTGAVGGTGAVGNLITYTFTVTNTGNTTLSNVVVNDALTASVNLSVTPSTLAPNTTGTVTATYAIKQSDIDAGIVTNSATVTGTKPLGGTVSDTSGTTILDNIPTVTTLTPNSNIALVKTGVIGGTGTLGDIITYTFTVTNTGNTTLSNVVVNDALTASVNLAVTPSTLAPNATGIATATYIIKQVDVDAAMVTNSATVTGTKPLGGTVSDTSGTTILDNIPTVTTLTPNSNIALVKTGVVTGTGVVGNVITYTFTVTNTGNTTLSNIVVNDALTASVNLVLAPSTLAPNATGTVTATYIIKQVDVDAGMVTNSATVTGTKPLGGTVSDTSGTTILNNTPTVTNLTPNPNIALVKTAVVGGTGAVGSLITYTFTVVNTGTTTLTDVVVNDALTASVNLAVTPSTLAPNGVGTATATYMIKQSDIDLGIVTNSATVSGTLPLGGIVSDISGATIFDNIPTVITLTPNSNIALVKSAVIGGTGAVGDLITYTFTVTNTGNTTLSNIVVNDALTASVNLAVTPSSLTPNAIGIASATYTIKQSDIDAGIVTNSATVIGTKPLGGTVSDISGTTITNNTPTVTTLTPNSNIALVKTAVIGGTGAVGNLITYTFTVTNTGNTTLSNIVVNDPLIGASDFAVTPSTLAPNATGIATATHAILQSDMDAGIVTNSATVTGTKPLGGTVSDISGTTITNNTPTVTTLTPNSNIALVKTGVVGGTGAIGNLITYTFTVANTGNTTLSNIVVNDALTASVNLAVTPSTLAPNTTGTVTATYTIKQSDIDAGMVTNSATVTGTKPLGGTVSDTSGITILDNIPTVTTLTPNSSIALVKTGVVGGTGAVGNLITYTFTVVNTGNTTLSNVVVNDALTASVNLSVTPSTLAPNTTGTVTATYAIKQSDIDAGIVTNSATVTGTKPSGGTVSDTSGTTITNNTPTVTTLSPIPSIALVKTGVIIGTGALGKIITYTFTVTNTGNTTLNNVVVNDALTASVNLSVTPSTLAPNATGIATAIYALTQVDLNAGKVTNSATVIAKDPKNNDVTDISGTAITNNTPTVTVFSSNQSIALVKTGVVGGTGAVGDVITYTFTVTNTGDTTLTNVIVNDPLTASVNLALSLSTLTPNAIAIATATYTIKQTDIDAGKVTNSATVSGTTPDNVIVTDISGTTITNNTPTVTILTPNSSIALVKVGAVGATVTVGDIITYTFKVTNTGNTTLSNVVVNDVLTASINLAVTPSTLAPNATGTATATYIIKASDIIAGKVTNSATVTGTKPSGGTVSDISGTTITDDIPTITNLSPNPSIKITQDGVYVDLNHDGVANVGDGIAYTYVLTNTGNLALTNIVITDNNTTAISGSLSSLAVGVSNSTNFTGIYMIKNADIESGYVYNLATVTALSSTNTTITATSTDPTPCTSCPVSPSCLACTIAAVPQTPSIALVKKAVFNDENKDGYAQVGETVSYTFTVMNTGNLALINVVVTDALPGVVLTGGPISLALGQTDTTSFSGVYHVTQQDIINGSVTNQAMVKATNVANIVVTDMSDSESPLKNDATVLSLDGCVVEVFNALSPGNDGYHDFFLIRGIECYPKNTVEIYNRWGIKVYDAEGYNNTNVVFRGVSEGRGTVSQSQGLPTGTYFYIIKYQDFNGNGIDKSGYLDLNRD